MAYRATKSGLSADVQDKLDKKYDPELASTYLQWLSGSIGENFDTSGDRKNFQEVLCDGYYLAKLANRLKAGSIKEKEIVRHKMAFKQMDLIQKAVNVFVEIGVMKNEAFQSVDLTEATNLHQVIICLQAVGRKSGFGPKESVGEKREWTEEQLKAGQNVIGLQMGTNKGASQAGMNLGKHRMITDDKKF